MEPVYRYSESTVKPEPIWVDITTVYLRKNVSEEQRVVYEDGTKTTFYTYQEAALSHEEFNEYSKLMQAERAIYGAKDSTNIVNLMTGQETSDSYQFAIMEAIAELYDTVATLNISITPVMQGGVQNG